jgi:hypothetical protein
MMTGSALIKPWKRTPELCLHWLILGGEVGVCVQTRLTIIEEDQQKDPETSRGDVLIFPDMVKYK